jgi:hypothetical protein
VDEHTEMRLMVIAELLNKAVAELDRVMTHVKSDAPLPGDVAENNEGGDDDG